MRWQDVQSWEDIERLRLTPEELQAFEGHVRQGGEDADRLLQPDALAADIGPAAVDRGRELITPLVASVIEWLDSFEEEFAPLPEKARDALLFKILNAYEKGYILAAGEYADKRRDGARGSARTNAAKAEVRRRRIVEAYETTDPTLPEAERYDRVRQATGVKSHETIRKALRSS